MSLFRCIASLICSLLVFDTLAAQEVLTISDSIVDHILFVDDSFMSSVPGKRGGCSLIDLQTFDMILERSGAAPKLMPGGSSVNLLKGLAHLGHRCTLVVQVGNDPTGQFFVSRLSDQGIRLRMQTVSSPTGKSACLVTPNGERTMRTFLGASGSNSNLNLHREDFQSVNLFHLEGYQLKHHNLVRKALELSKQSNALVSLDLSSFEIARTERGFIEELLNEGSIDLFFANQDEALAFTGLNPKEACSYLASFCDVAIVTMGEKGCIVQEGSNQFHYPAFKVPVIDTIGAGDLFMSGFLHGYLHQWSVKDCAWLGSHLASEVVQVIGAEIPEERWDSILQKAKL
ncbi:MAG: adenosine kinase [Verrucomicrobia bacterium]|nr:adenosine kinase [Verrucomicrobiota bacterium]